MLRALYTPNGQAANAYNSVSVWRTVNACASPRASPSGRHRATCSSSADPFEVLATGTADGGDVSIGATADSTCTVVDHGTGSAGAATDRHRHPGRHLRAGGQPGPDGDLPRRAGRPTLGHRRPPYPGRLLEPCRGDDVRRHAGRPPRRHHHRPRHVGLPSQRHRGRRRDRAGRRPRPGPGRGFTPADASRYRRRPSRGCSTSFAHPRPSTCRPSATGPMATPRSWSSPPVRDRATSPSAPQACARSPVPPSPRPALASARSRSTRPAMPTSSRHRSPASCSVAKGNPCGRGDNPAT